MLPSACMAVAAALSAALLRCAWSCGGETKGGERPDGRCGEGAGDAVSPVLRDDVPTACTEAADIILEAAVGGSRAVF